MSSRAIAELCGVSPGLVDGFRQLPTVGTSKPSTETTALEEYRTGTDGKQYPATRRPRIETTPHGRRAPLTAFQPRRTAISRQPVFGQGFGPRRVPAPIYALCAAPTRV